MLIAVFSDLHVHNYKAHDNNGSRLKNCLKVPETIFKFCDKNGIEIIVFTGDWFDNQGAIPTEVINETEATLRRLFDTYPDIKIIAISGNHDHASKNLINKPAITALTHLDSIFENFVLIDNRVEAIETEDERIIFCGLPYYELPEDYHSVLKDFNPLATQVECDAKILLTHQTPTGLNNPNIPTDTDVNDPLYDPYDIVLNGHIHAFQAITDKFINVGSPLHRDLGDEGVTKGFLVINTQNLPKFKFISLKGKFPEFQTQKLKLGEKVEYDGFNYIVPSWTEETTENTDNVNVDEFGNDLTAETLLTNFWSKQSNDKALLTTGLKLIN